MSREPAYLWLWLVVGITTPLIYFGVKVHYSYRILHIAYLRKIASSNEKQEPSTDTETSHDEKQEPSMSPDEIQ